MPNASTGSDEKTSTVPQAQSQTSDAIGLIVVLTLVAAAIVVGIIYRGPISRTASDAWNTLVPPVERLYERTPATNQQILLSQNGTLGELPRQLTDSGNAPVMVFTFLQENRATLVFTNCAATKGGHRDCVQHGTPTPNHPWFMVDMVSADPTSTYLSNRVWVAFPGHNKHNIQVVIPDDPWTPTTAQMQPGGLRDLRAAMLITYDAGQTTFVWEGKGWTLRGL